MKHIDSFVLKSDLQEDGEKKFYDLMRLNYNTRIFDARILANLVEL